MELAAVLCPHKFPSRLKMLKKYLHAETPGRDNNDNEPLLRLVKAPGA